MPATGLTARRNVLHQHYLFRDLSEAELDELLTHARMTRVRAGDTICLRGAPGAGMMAILSGEVTISVTGADGRQIILTRLGEGEIFGEIALLDGGERTADVVAAVDYQHPQPQVCGAALGHGQAEEARPDHDQVDVHWIAALAGLR